MTRVERNTADRIHETRVGSTVFGDPMLARQGSFVLAALSDEAYDADLGTVTK
jgi:hypothetical protein